MTSNALSLLGLALRGGNLAIGEEPVAEACRTRRAKLVFTAAGAADNSVRRAQHWAESAGAPWAALPWDKGALGRALGRSSCAMAALTDPGLAAALAQKLAAADPKYQPLAETLVVEKPSRTRPEKKKNARAKKPAVRET